MTTTDPNTERQKKTRKSKVRWTHRKKVNSKRNSLCGTELAGLDWKTWYMDTSCGGCYLHVRRWRLDEGATMWRVMCRATDHPRLALENGELYWLIDEPEQKAALDAAKL